MGASQTIDRDTFLNAYAKASAREKTELLSRISSDMILGLASGAPDLLRSETNPSVAAALIKTFKSHWPKASLQLIASRLSARQLNLRITALEALTALAPQELLHSLPGLLSSRDPRLWGLAVQGLAKIDLQEALRHLENMLMNGSIKLRQAGLQCLLLLPFGQTKPLLLKMFSAESDPVMLKKAGMVFQTNPDPDVPYRLWEVAKFSPAPKAEIVMEILKGALTVLEKSGILDEPFAHYRQKLQTWMDHRIALQAVHEMVANFVDGATPDPEAISEFLQGLMNLPGIKSALGDALTWPKAEPIRPLIQKFLGSPESKTRTDATREAVWDNQLPLAVKLRLLGNLKSEDRETFRPILERLLEDPDVLVSLKIGALRCAARLGITDFCNLAEGWLTNFDVTLSIVSLEYLAAFQPQDLLPILTRFIRRGDNRQKIGAFKLLKQHFPGKAEELIFAFLKESKLENQTIALLGTVFLDFALVREPLTQYLEKNPATPLLEQAMFLFQNNPDFENLYCLFVVEKAMKPTEAEMVHAARKQIASFLVQYNRMNADSLPEFEKEFQQRWKHEQARKASPPAYSLESISKVKE